jgi:FixJ family two-component response regulator
MPTMSVNRAPVRAGGSVGGKVFLVDDEPGFRRAIVRLLRASGFEAEAFADAEAFLATSEHSGIGVPSCLLADLRMPGLDGLDLQAELRRRGIDTPIVFVSGRADLPSGVQAMKSGAIDFLQKPVSADVLTDAVRKALEHDRKRHEAHAELATLRSRASLLTPREREVFALVVSGMANKQVAAELGACEKTIKVHRARVMEKMSAGSLAELVRMADRLNVTLEGARKGFVGM